MCTLHELLDGVEDGIGRHGLEAAPGAGPGPRGEVCIKAVIERPESVELWLKLLAVLPQGLKGVVGDGLEVLPRHDEVEQPVAEFTAKKFAWELGRRKKEDSEGQGCPVVKVAVKAEL